MITTFKTRVCIVDDYKLTRATLKYVLDDFKDVEVVATFENSKFCIDYLKENQADIILMGINLKSTENTETIKILKRKYPSIKIIALTSNCSKQEIARTFEAGADAYILKDIDFEELHEVINSVKKGALWFDAKIASIAKDIFKELNYKNFENKDNKIKLTTRESEVLKLICLGLSNTEIADRLFISAHTAKAHVSNIITKLQAKDRVEVAVKACKMGMID